MTASSFLVAALSCTQLVVHFPDRTKAWNTSLRSYRERSHAIPAVVLPALNGEANRRPLCPRIQHRNAEIVSTFCQTFRNIQRAIEYRVSGKPFPDVHWNSNDGHRLARSQFHG